MKTKFSLNQMKLDEISNSKTNSYFSQKWNCKGVKPKTHRVQTMQIFRWFCLKMQKMQKKCKKCKKMKNDKNDRKW